MAEDLVFYTNPMSRGRIVRWMLEEVGAPYRTEFVELGAAMKAPEYLAINPMGKVPAIVRGTEVVTECAAICAWLADVFPDAGLAPPPQERAAYYRWMFFAAGPFEAATVDRALGVQVPPDKEAMVGYGRFETAMDGLEAALVVDDFVAGPKFTAADVYVGSQVGWGLRFGTIEDRPAFRRYWERLADRPALRRAVEIDDAAMDNG
jgi:glutathione S-transferase